MQYKNYCQLSLSTNRSYLVAALLSQTNPTFSTLYMPMRGFQTKVISINRGNGLKDTNEKYLGQIIVTRINDKSANSKVLAQSSKLPDSTFAFSN